MQKLKQYSEIGARNFLVFSNLLKTHLKPARGWYNDALAGSLLAKILVISKYTVSKSMGVKRGQTGKLNFNENPGYLLVVAKNANTILLTAEIKPGGNYSFRAIIDSRNNMSGELTAI